MQAVTGQRNWAASSSPAGSAATPPCPRLDTATTRDTVATFIRERDTGERRGRGREWRHLSDRVRPATSMPTPRPWGRWQQTRPALLNATRGERRVTSTCALSRGSSTDQPRHHSDDNPPGPTRRHPMRDRSPNGWQRLSEIPTSQRTTAVSTIPPARISQRNDCSPSGSPDPLAPSRTEGAKSETTLPQAAH